MEGSTSAQAGSGRDAARPEAGCAASTRGQRAVLAERLGRHVLALEGVRHPVAAPERHRAARDYVAHELAASAWTCSSRRFRFGAAPTTTWSASCPAAAYPAESRAPAARRMASVNRAAASGSLGS